LVISELTGSHLARAIRGLLHDPNRLKRLAEGSASEYRSYHPRHVRDQILLLGEKGALELSAERMSKT